MKRRDFLKALTTSVAAQSALVSLVDSILAGVNRKAYGQTLGRRYIYIQQFGAPPRQMYDLFLTPYSSTGFTAPPGLGTVYRKQNGRYIDVSYETVSLKGINVPKLWSAQIPRPGGGTRPMADLLDNLLHIRGIATGNAAHVAASEGHFRPFGAQYSLPGLAGSASNSPLRAVMVRADNYILKSPQPISVTRVGVGSTALSDLLAPFQLNLNGAATNFSQNLTTVWTPMMAALEALNSESLQRNPSSQAMRLAQQEALDMMSRSFGNLDTQWTQLKAKYEDLITRAIFTNDIVGINDSPVGTTGARDNSYRLEKVNASTSILATIPDLRSMFVNGTTKAKEMAEHFAIAEFIVRNNLSDSIVISPKCMVQMQYETGAYKTMGFDEHGVGCMYSMILNALYFRALSACTMELIETLKSVNQFNNSVVIVGSEFNRDIYRDTSEHGFQGASAAIYSGIIQGPKVIGNIKNSNWGEGTNVAELGMPVDLGHLGATVATLLGVQNPVTARSPLVSVTGGSVSTLVERAKQT